MSLGREVNKETIRRVTRREIRCDTLLKRLITSLHICLIAWCRIVKRGLLLIEVTLLLLIAFFVDSFICFSAIACCNSLYSYSCDYMSYNIVIAYFCYGGTRPKCFLSVVLIMFWINIIRELIYSVEKPDKEIWLLKVIILKIII